MKSQLFGLILGVITASYYGTLIGFFSSIYYGTYFQQSDKTGLIVKTTSGTVQGFRDPSIPEVRQFLAIPFAEPPVGQLRWLPPTPLASVQSTIEATAFGPACPQYMSKLHTLYNDLVPEFNVVKYPSPAEDCLTLSVWAPEVPNSGINGPQNKSSNGFPVIIFVYGGGFKQGGTNTMYQYPMKWVQRSKSHIVISIQYRVGVFGFPQARGLKEQNLGILDQRLAIEWVRDNAAAFGGDPSRITLWGQSAGAISIDFLNFAYPEDPIVKGFIADSGTAFLRRAPLDPGFSNFSFVASNLGCSLRDDGERELECMRSLPQQTIVDFVGRYADDKKEPKLTFGPRPDGKVIFEDYNERYAKGKLAPIPAIFGSNSNEGVAFVPFPTDPAECPDQEYADVATKELFHCYAATSSVLRKQAGRKTYRYLYRGNFTNISPRPWMGAYHSAELPLIMGTSGDFRGPNSELETSTSEHMQDLWLSFMRDPESAPGWLDSAEGHALVFGDGDGAVTKGALFDIDSVCNDSQ